MKKITYLFTLMFALMLMSVSCCKDDDDILIPTDLSGNQWNCVSLDYAGTLYDTPAEFAALNVTKDFVTLDFKFNNDLTVTLHTNYTGTNISNANWFSTPFSYSITGDILDIDDGYLKFKIGTHTATTLELTMTVGNTNMPIGGKYSLTR